MSTTGFGSPRSYYMLLLFHVGTYASRLHQLPGSVEQIILCLDVIMPIHHDNRTYRKISIMLQGKRNGPPSCYTQSNGVSMQGTAPHIPGPPGQT